MTTTEETPPPKVLRPLSAMTQEERDILDAYLATGSCVKAAAQTHRHRKTVAAVVRRYAPALRSLLRDLSMCMN